MAVFKFKDSSGNWVNLLGGGVTVEGGGDIPITSTPAEDVRVWVDPTEDQTGEYYTKEEVNAQFASITHADKHAVGGEDEVTPASIGAYTQEEVDDMLQEKQNIINGLEKQLQSRPNPNLLDNWYFGNPVNQREFTTTTKSGSYCVDRWYVGGYRTGTRELTLNDGYISLSCDDNTDDAYYELVQYIEANIGKRLVEKQVTLSILSDQGLNYQTFVLRDNTYATFDVDTRGTAFVRAKIDGTAEVRIRTYYGKSINIVAAKLELGSQQTLAHQDENDNWVLNEIPNYGEQLRKCQRYFRRFPAWYCVGSQQAGNAIFRYPLNPPMRAVPTIAMQYPGDLDAALHNGSGNITPSSVTLDWNNSCDAIGFFFRGATGDAFTCTRYVDVNADL